MNINSNSWSTFYSNILKHYMWKCHQYSISWYHSFNMNDAINACAFGCVATEELSQ